MRWRWLCLEGHIHLKPVQAIHNTCNVRGNNTLNCMLFPAGSSKRHSESTGRSWVFVDEGASSSGADRPSPGRDMTAVASRVHSEATGALPACDGISRCPVDARLPVVVIGGLVW